MKEVEKVVSQSEALKKYQYSTQNGDGTCTVRVTLNDDGSVNPCTYNMQYRQELENEQEESSNQEKNQEKTKGKEEENNDGEESCCVKTICSPFILIWWLIKCVIALIMWPFRIIFSCKCSYPTPRFSFKKF